MTRSIPGTRRAAALLAGGAAAAVLLLSGCSAGQIAETARIVPAVPGVNQDAGPFRVRNGFVEFRPGGYPRGASASLDVRIFNDSGQSVTVRVSSPDAESVALVGGTASASPSPSATPSATRSAQPPATAPAEIPIPAGGFVASPNVGRSLQLIGLRRDLQPGNSVRVVFDFGNNVRIEVGVPLGVPLTPEPRATGDQGQEQQHR